MRQRRQEGAVPLSSCGSWASRIQRCLRCCAGGHAAHIVTKRCGCLLTQLQEVTLPRCLVPCGG